VDGTVNKAKGTSKSKEGRPIVLATATERATVPVQTLELTQVLEGGCMATGLIQATEVDNSMAMVKDLTAADAAADKAKGGKDKLEFTATNNFKSHNSNYTPKK
jgi:hypothetical protein